MKPHCRAVVIGGGVVGASDGFGYTIGKSVALALVDDGFAGEGMALCVHIVGVERTARVIAASPYGPQGRAMRQ
ncbi:glycine cleavage T C-terminal barrel domain-containing protein [Mesorhizobium sp. B2-7-3]|uniref:glycine cleavage T C-terminal barrel domain-containing protein n=1 Tax=Mesorhizobium sp. B2-7-3 TaxID=2589907 RepID=UPI001FEE99B9|nr:glycine cleavage T C-terminal barrel domain-containing protein [Mesorhizobium sp. B2-7-3]